MEKPHQLTDSEKELLTVIGKYPEIPMKELLNHTTYKWESTVVKKLEKLKEQQILYGPVYDINYGILCRNPLHKLVCILEFTQDYETVTEYLKLIESIIWIFPVLSSHKKVLNAGFISSNDAEVRDLLQLLKDSNVISDFIIHACPSKRMVENPHFSGDFNPSLDNLLDLCDLPDISFGHHDTDWSECDIRILPYLRRGAKLMEILKDERRVHHRIWTYEQIRYSYEKMVENKLIEKKYIYRPFPCNQCAHFDLFFKTEHKKLTLRILCNFAKGARIYKEYMLFDQWGMLVCISHPVFLTDLMHKLDQVDEIKEKEVYQARSNSRVYSFGQPLETKYFDFDAQTLEYPYYVYEEKIKEKLESERQESELELFT